MHRIGLTLWLPAEWQQTMETTVQICGVDYPSCELVQHSTFGGIKTPEKTFWLFPVCDDAGREIKSLPPYLPRKIRAVTLEPPDLTKQYPETVRELFDKRRSYFNTATLQKYQSQYPDTLWLTEERFQKERSRILGETLEDFTRDPRARQMIWDRHGTKQLANQVGYLGDVYVTETPTNGRRERVAPAVSPATSLYFKLMSARNIGDDAAWAIVNNLKFVMIYENVPEQQFIYLQGMKIAAATPHLTAPAPQLEVNVNVETHNLNEIIVLWPGEKNLEEIKATTQETLTTVKQIQGKKRAKEKKWHQKGGRGTSKWRRHKQEASKLARFMCQVRDSWIKTHGTKRGAIKKAIERGRAWWRATYKDDELKNFLDEKKISDANLYRLMNKDFRQGRKSSS